MSEITVVVPVYNCENYLDRCISSVLGQSFREFELILVNDGSTDGSGAICRSYAARDSRVRVIEKENGGGAGEARNVGAAHAHTPLLAFLDSDDWYEETMLERLYGAQREGDYDLVVCGYRSMTGRENESDFCDVSYEPTVLTDPEAVRDFFVAHYPEGMVGYPWNKLYKRELIETYGICFPKIRRLEDGIFNVDYIGHVKSLCVLPDPLYCYRASEQVEQRKLPADFFRLMKVFVEQYYGKLSEWGYETGKVEEPIVFYFLNDFVCCLENIIVGGGVSAKDRKAVLTELAADEMTNRMLQKEVPLKRYSSLVLRLFAKRFWRRMAAVIRIKIWMKTRLYGMFRILKRVMN